MADYTQTELLNEVSKIFRASLSPGKTNGSLNTVTEYQQLLEMVSVTLLLNPDSVFYIARLAANQLSNTILQESAVLEDLLVLLDDLDQVGSPVRDTTTLSNARTTLLTLGSAQSITNRPETDRFIRQMDTFATQLRKNLVSASRGVLVRPREEARNLIQTNLTTLEELHSKLLDQLAALLRVLDSFLSLDLASKVSNTVLSTISTRLQNTIESVSSSTDVDNLTATRKMFLEALANKISVKALMSFTDPTGDKYRSPPRPIPASMEHYGRVIGSGVPASVITGPGPWLLPVSSPLVLEITGGNTLTINLDSIIGAVLNARNSEMYEITENAQNLHVIVDPDVREDTVSSASTEDVYTDNFMPLGFKHLCAAVSFPDFLTGGGGSSSRAKSVAVATVDVDKDVNVTGGGVDPNINALLGDYSSADFIEDVDVYLNGMLLRNGAENAGGTVGETWGLIGNPSSQDLYAVAYGNGIWIAVGDTQEGGATIIRSEDNGESWNSIPNPGDFLLNSVATNDMGVWVAVGTSYGAPCILRSEDDGLNWFVISSPNPATLISIAYNSGVWIAVGEPRGGDSYLIRSVDDGLTWTERPTTRADLLTGVACGDGIWIAVGDSSISTPYAMRSTDNGLTWAAVPWMPSGFKATNITYREGIFVVVGYGSSPVKIIRSDDGGISWSQIDNPVNNNLWFVTSAPGGVFVAVGDPISYNMYVIRSFDAGLSWTQISSEAFNTYPSYQSMWGLAFGNDVMMGVGSQGSLGMAYLIKSVNDYAFDVYPGDNPSSGDLKFKFNLHASPGGPDTITMVVNGASSGGAGAGANDLQLRYITDLRILQDAQAFNIEFNDPVLTVSSFEARDEGAIGFQLGHVGGYVIDSAGGKYEVTQILSPTDCVLDSRGNVPDFSSGLNLCGEFSSGVGSTYFLFSPPTSVAPSAGNRVKVGPSIKTAQLTIGSRSAADLISDIQNEVGVFEPGQQAAALNWHVKAELVAGDPTRIGLHIRSKMDPFIQISGRFLKILDPVGPSEVIDKSAHIILGFREGESDATNFLSPSELADTLSSQPGLKAEVVTTVLAEGLLETSATSSNVTDLSGNDFVTAGIAGGDQLEILGESSAGVYGISSLLSSTSLTLNRSPFGVKESRLPYRIFRDQVKISLTDAGPGTYLSVVTAPDELELANTVVYGMLNHFEAVDKFGNKWPFTNVVAGDLLKVVGQPEVAVTDVIDSTTLVLARGLPSTIDKIGFEIRSASAKAYNEFHDKLNSFSTSGNLLKTNGFDKGVGAINTACTSAILPGQSFLSSRNQARKLVADLLSIVTSAFLRSGEYVTKVTVNPNNLGSILGSYSATSVGAVDNVVEALLDRKYDRAAGLLQSGKLEEFYSTTEETGSFSGAVTNASKSVIKDLPRQSRTRFDVLNQGGLATATQTLTDSDKDFSDTNNQHKDYDL
jgi:hypothetical protein